MANTINANVLVNGSRNLVIHFDIKGDGSGEELNTVIVSSVTYGIESGSSFAVHQVDSTMEGFSVSLLWDATVNINFLTLPQGHSGELEYQKIGGLQNNAGAGKTGDILISTTGLGLGDTGSFTLRMIKKAV